MGALSRFIFYNGNLKTEGNRTYTYDYNNRLIEVNIWTGNLVKYSYDILGRRTKKIDYSKSTTNPESTIYVYSGDNILSEYKTYGVQVGWTGSLVPVTLKKNYINGIGTDSLIAYDAEEQLNPTSTGKTTKRYYYHTNQLGSVTALTSSTGAVVQSYSYDAFGKAYVRNGSGTWTTLIDINTYTGSTYSNSRLYTGREYDKEIWMYYLRARYYNANTGKFISRDPIGQNDQVNLYTYVGNSPLKYVDRMGREKVLILVGKDKEGSNLLKNWADYQIQKYLKQGIKRKNIILKEWVVDPTNFNDAVDWYNWNIQDIVYLTHGASDNLWKWAINSENVNQLNWIKQNSTNTTNLTIIACHAGEWENSIAQKMSNELNLPVRAYDKYILINQAASMDDWAGAFIFWNMFIHLPLSIFYDTWENSKFWEKTFNPNF